MSNRRNLVRRVVVTGALAATLVVVGGSGAAMAAGGRHGSGSCARASHEVERIEKKLARLSNSSGPGGRREKADKVAARQAKAEQKLAELKATCQS